MDTTILADITKSVDQLCTQMSLTNIQVPRLNTFEDVFEFINEFEMATATLPDDQRVKLLVKAFPPGRYQNWYDTTIKPLVDSNSSWSAIKPKITQRFAVNEDRDRHFSKLQRMKFADDGSVKLYDYIEELLFSFNKVFPKEKDLDTKVRYIKSNLPSSIKPYLTLINSYNQPRDMEDFMSGIRQFDVLRSEGFGKSDGKINTSEMTNLLKQLLSEIQSVKPRNVVAAYNPKNSREASPNRPFRFDRFQDRGRSPDRANYHNRRRISPSPSRRHNEQPRSSSDRHYYQQDQDNFPMSSGGQARDYDFRPASSQPQRGNQLRPASPLTGQHRSSNNMRYRENSPSRNADQFTQRPSRQNPSDHQTRSMNNNLPNAFDSERYYSRFGIPPKPCSICGAMHWFRHCPDNLKE